MTTKIKVQRICQFCGNEFTAQTTVTKYCSLRCNQKAYKENFKAKKLQKSNIETFHIKTRPIEEAKAKEFLNVRDVAILLSCSLHTAYKLINNGIIKSVNLAERMTRVKRSELNKLLD